MLGGLLALTVILLLAEDVPPLALYVSENV